LYIQKVMANPVTFIDFVQGVHECLTCCLHSCTKKATKLLHRIMNYLYNCTVVQNGCFH
jgi:hypothetical protein